MDHRKLKRRHLIFYLRVLERDSGDLVGHLVDITPEGIMLMSEQPHAPGEKHAMVMDLPVEICGRPRLSFDAECVWSKTEPTNPQLHDSGWKVTDLPLAELHALDVLIDDYGFRD